MRNSLPSLARPVLSLAIAFSSAAGFIFFSHHFSPAVLACAAGIFLLAAGASALNQYQEREQDALMERTRKRPVPSGAIEPRSALTVALILAVAGIVVLWSLCGWIPALLGFANLAWYNGVYTPLKRRSYFAVLAGAVNGAVPPMIGWVAAGGALNDPKILFLAFFIYIWQIPHFWLLLMMYGEDYRKAGFPTVTDRISRRLQPVVIMAWVFATAISTLFLPFFGIIRSRILVALIITSAVMLVAVMAIFIAKKEPEPGYRKAFIIFNAFMVVTFLLVIADQLG
jgi:heme o synthase